MKVKVQTTSQEPYEIEIPAKPVDVPTMMYKSGFKACDEIFSKKIEKLKIEIVDSESAMLIEPYFIEKCLKQARLRGLKLALEIMEEK
jgi:hypothetical protein